MRKNLRTRIIKLLALAMVFLAKKRLRSRICDTECPKCETYLDVCKYCRQAHIWDDGLIWECETCRKCFCTECFVSEDGVVCDEDILCPDCSREKAGITDELSSEAASKLMTEQAVNELIQDKMLAGDPDLGPILVLYVDAECKEVYWYHEISEEVRHSRIAIIEDGSAVVTECLGQWDSSI